MTQIKPENECDYIFKLLTIAKSKNFNTDLSLGGADVFLRHGERHARVLLQQWHLYTAVRRLNAENNATTPTSLHCTVLLLQVLVPLTYLLTNIFVRRLKTGGGEKFIYKFMQVSCNDFGFGTEM